MAGQSGGHNQRKMGVTVLLDTFEEPFVSENDSLFIKLAN
jgi:hypothetical protein